MERSDVGQRPSGTPPPIPTARRSSFGVMMKPAGALCNLNCEYCYYLSKRELYPGARLRMSQPLLEEYIRQQLDCQPDGPVTLSWQGGEPTLLGVEFFRAAFAAAEHHRRPGQQVTHALQTNGTLLDDHWGELLADADVLVGISLDGPPELHDVYRQDRGGKPSSDRVLAGLDVLCRWGVERNILCTVNGANGDHPLAVYRYFRDELGERFLQFIPVVERAGVGGRTGDRAAGDRRCAGSHPAVSGRSVRPEQWGKFLAEIFDEWLAGDVGRVFVQQFDAALAAWVGAPQSVCVFAQTCGRALALEHNGDLYSCDHFVDPEHLLGNIRERPLLELARSPAQQRFGEAKHTTLPALCQACDVKFACWGECPRNRFSVAPDGSHTLNYLCAGYLYFFHHIDGPMRLMAELLRRGQEPARAVEILAPHSAQS